MVLSRIFYHWEKRLSQQDTNRKVRAFDWGLDFVPGDMRVEDPRLYMLEYARKAVAESDLYQWLEYAGFKKMEISIVAREEEAPHFQTILACGEK